MSDAGAIADIEAVLAGVPGIRRTAVVANARRPGASPRFAAYYVAGGQCPPVAEIMRSLRARLPADRHPHALVRLDRLPITDSGEVDADLLPDPAVVDAECFLAPRNHLDFVVRGILADVLGAVEHDVGVRDDFFSLGGNSLLMIQLARRLTVELNVDIGIDTLLRHQMVADLVDNLDVVAESMAEIPRFEVADETQQPLSFAQQALWFLTKYEQGNDTYNVCLLYEVLAGTDLRLLERSVLAIYERQEALRTVIKEDAEFVPYQSVLSVEEAPLRIEQVIVVDLDDLAAVVERDSKVPFDLAEDVPFRVRAYTVGAGSAAEVAIGFFLHHISFDGWSADLLLTEIGEYYSYFVRSAVGEEATVGLPELSIRYRDYAAWQRVYLSGPRLAELVAHWRSTLDGIPALNLPTDRPRPKSIDYHGAMVAVVFDPVVSATLRELAKSLGVSLFSLMLTGWSVVLSRFSGQDEFVVGVPAVNRRQIQTQDLIGCFMNSLPVELRIETQNTVASTVAKVAERLKQAQCYQDLPFERLVGELAPPRETGRHPIFQVWFDVHSFAETQADHDSPEIRYRPAAPLRTHPLDERNAPGNREVVARFDLCVVINDGQDELTGTVSYPTSLFDRSTVERLVQEYQAVLADFCDKSATTQPISGVGVRG